MPGKLEFVSCVVFFTVQAFLPATLTGDTAQKDALIFELCFLQGVHFYDLYL